MNRRYVIDYQIDRACLYLSLLCEFFIGVFVDKYIVKFKSYSTDLYAIEYLGTLLPEQMKLIYNLSFIMYDINVGKIQRLCLLPDIFITQFLFYLGSQIGFENNGIGKKHVSYEAIMVGNGIENYY